MYDDRFWLFSALIIALLGLVVAIKAADLPSSQSKEPIDSLVKRLAKPYDLEQTVRTIIRLESNDGQYLVNLQDPACGITHINIQTYMKRHKIRDTNFNRNKACADLISSPELAIANAIEELLYWQSVHCSSKCTVRQYQNVVKSYNTGWSYRGSAAAEYWQKFRKAFNDLYGKKK